MADSWKDVADALAARMQYQAAAAGSVDPDLALAVNSPGCSHQLPEADPDNCPFCADRQAYLRYVAKRDKEQRRSRRGQAF